MSTETIASNTGFEAELNDWIAQEKAAIRLMSIVGTLRFDKAVELIIFRLPLHDSSVRLGWGVHYGRAWLVRCSSIL